MTVYEAQIDAWLRGKEDEHLEFKEAKQNFHFEKLVKYCAALANEGGGSIVLGVTDKRPRRVVGTNSFQDLERTKAGLIEKLRVRIEAHEVQHTNGRVLVFTAPARPIGMPIPVEGAYWMRAGEDLVPMTPDLLQRIFAEAGPDFSAQVCESAGLADLDPDAIELLRRLWQRKTPAQDLSTRSHERLLTDAELLANGGVTYAALILLGTRDALGRHLAQAEIVFEYRSDEMPGPAAERHEFRSGFLPVLDEIWRLVSLRNDLQHFQQGLFVWDVPTFQERAVREAVLNAVSHRDYRHGGSVFVRQYPRRIEIVSPGGFPPGINEANLLWEQNPRNRRIAEVLSRCGLVERSGQGFDWIYRECIRGGKRLPDFSRTGEHSVWVTLHGEIQDPEFLRFLEELGNETLATFDLEDLLLIDLIHREQKVPSELAGRVAVLLDHGVIERVGKGRGTRYLLSRRFYRSLGHSGTYTRRRGLDRETNKSLLLKHIEESVPAGASFAELQEVLPGLSRDQVQTLLRELKQDGLVEVQGATRAGRWQPGQKRNPTQ
jgi:ATP-dependent DNA helicase RecG